MGIIVAVGDAFLMMSSLSGFFILTVIRMFT